MDIKLHPADHSKDYGSLGIKLPMNSNKKYNRAEIFNLSYTTEEQAVSNYINLLLTKRGERYMQPEFGVGLHMYLFEQNTDRIKIQLESEIRAQADQWLPYIFNEYIQIKDYAEFSEDSKHGIHITIGFKVTEHGANKTIVIFPGINGNLEVEIL